MFAVPRQSCQQHAPCMQLSKFVRCVLQVRKEVIAGTYRLTSYFWAKTLVSVPFEALIAMVFSAITYWMIGFQVCQCLQATCLGFSLLKNCRALAFFGCELPLGLFQAWELSLSNRFLTPLGTSLAHHVC